MFDLRLACLVLSCGLMAAPTPTQEQPTPTAEHESLLESVGVWEGTMTAYLEGMDPMETPAREVVRGIGPFWTEVHFSCDFMGAPYSGRGHMGFDPTSGEYLGTWVDSMSPHLSIMRGSMEDGGKTLVMKWMAPGPDGELVQHWSKTVREKDAYTCTFFIGDEGTKTMQMSMKRTAEAVEAGAGK